MAKNQNLTKIALMRWDQFNNEWIPFTGFVDPKGHVQIEFWEVPPTDDSKNNGSAILTYDASDNLTQIDKVIDGVTYRKTFTWTSGNLTDISVWSIP